MESFLNRYRNITVLLLVIFAQLVLLAVQVKNDQDVRLIRVWTVTAVTPLARVMEAVRGGSIGFVRNYILHARRATRKTAACRPKSDRLKMENQFLQERARHRRPRQGAGSCSRQRTPSKTLAAQRDRDRRGRQFQGGVRGPRLGRGRGCAAWRWSRRTASWAK